MKLVTAANTAELARVSARHTEKLTRAIIRHILSVDNAVLELDKLGVRFWVSDSSLRRVKDLRPIMSVPALVEIALKTGLQAVEPLPDGNVLVQTESGSWIALP